jgi:hypothetical protein
MRIGSRVEVPVASSLFGVSEVWTSPITNDQAMAAPWRFADKGLLQRRRELGCWLLPKAPIGCRTAGIGDSKNALS